LPHAQVEGIPTFVPRNSFRAIWQNANHHPRTLFESRPQRRRKYWLSALKIADSCADLTDKFRTGRPCDVIQYEIDPFGYLVKMLAL
jgi:hypothetical protein